MRRRRKRPEFADVLADAVQDTVVGVDVATNSSSTST
jgi:hypothetical protein